MNQIKKTLHPYFLVLVCLIVLASYSCEVLGDTFVSPSGPNIKYFGRIDRTDPNEYRYTWPGIYFKFRLKAKEFKLIFNDHNNIYHIIINGSISKELRPEDGVSTNLIALDSGAGKTNDIIIFKRTENTWQPGRFLGLLIDGSAEISEPKIHKRKIEFIGDSFTVGYGNLSDTKECDNNKVWETTDSYKSYGTLVADYFKAEFMINAFSGRGLVQNYGDKSPNPSNAVPEMYKRTLQNLPEPEWEFNIFKPDVVVIFLGLNDFSTEGDPTEEQYTGAYLGLISKLRKHYDGVKFLCMGYPGMNIDVYANKMVQSQKEAGYNDIEYALMPAPTGLGCHWHPDVKSHSIMANAVIEAIKSYMKW